MWREGITEMKERRESECVATKKMGILKRVRERETQSRMWFE